MKIHFGKKKSGGKKMNRRFFPIGRNPYFDWKILIFFFISILVIVITLNVYIFFGVFKGELFLVPQGQEVIPKTFDQAFIKEILSDFENKNKELKELQQNRTEIADPSL